MQERGRERQRERERHTEKEGERGREMYKLSTLSRKMALKLSRACGSTRDSGKLPFIASQTMGPSDSSAYDNAHRHTHTHTCTHV